MELNNFYKTELSPKEIFNSMKENIFDFSSNINSINPKYLYLRSKLLNIIREISAKMCFKSQTYFLSIYYLDILFTNKKNKTLDLNYNITALTCLLLSAKYCENDPIVPALKYFTKIYNKIIGIRNSISVNDLFYSEVLVIKLLNHKLNYYTIYDFNSFFFSNNILTKEQIKNINNNFEPNQNKFGFNTETNYIFTSILRRKRIYENIYRLTRYYFDIILYNKICLKYSSLLISIFILKKSIELVLFQEKFDKNKNIETFSKERFMIETNNYFNSIIKGYYQFDYETIPEYQKLIKEYDIIKLFNLHNSENNYNLYNNKPSKTLISFNKKNNDKTKIDKDIKKNDEENNIIRTKEKINFRTSKFNFHKLKEISNISRTQNENVLDNLSGQNIKSVITNNNKDKEKQKNLYRNFGLDSCLNNNYKTKEEKGKNSDINNYFSENLFSPNNKINLDKNILNRINKTKSKEKEKINKFDINDIGNNLINSIEAIGRFTLNTNENLNQLTNIRKPYFKKIIQNNAHKLNNKNLNLIQISNNKYNFDNENINPELMHKYNNILSSKINNKFITRYELNTESKLKNYANKKYNYIDFSLNKDFKEKASFSNNKDKKISKLLHINFDTKLTENISPSNTLYVNKKISNEMFSPVANITKANIFKKISENKKSKSINNFDTLISNRGNNSRYKDIQIRTKYIEQKFENKLKNYLYDSDEFNEKNRFNNKLAVSSSKKLKLQLMMKSKKEKTKENITKNKNKIIITEDTFSDNENQNKLNSEIDINQYIKAKKIEVKKNKFDNEIKYRLNKNKNNNILNFTGYTNSNLEDNIYKKNSSTIVINNNININFGNKAINGYKEIKKYGQNSISSLLHKIPLSYKNTEN